MTVEASWRGIATEQVDEVSAPLAALLRKRSRRLLTDLLRPYRRGVSLDWAREEIARCRGTDFDPEAVDAFLALGEEELTTILQMRSGPGLDLLIDSDARARYLAGKGLGIELIPA